eukprot:2195769-Prymnesium_polylepis.1
MAAKGGRSALRLRQRGTAHHQTRVVAVYGTRAAHHQTPKAATESCATRPTRRPLQGTQSIGP